VREIFEAELRQIGDDLIEMAAKVETAITHAGAALLDANLQVTQDVIAGDHAIDALYHALDERCIHVLAQQAPVATDLRTVVSAMRMSATLERMGDLARHVAEVARGRYPEHAIPEPALETFSAMVEAAIHAARAVAQLMTTHDLGLAIEIEGGDDVLDDLHLQTFGTILAPGWGGTTQEAIDITLVGRYLERFGDHATSIARRIIYLVTGAEGGDDNRG
jgi:phosphate transport system protein